MWDDVSLGGYPIAHQALGAVPSLRFLTRARLTSFFFFFIHSLGSYLQPQRRPSSTKPSVKPSPVSWDSLSRATPSFSIEYQEGPPLTRTAHRSRRTSSASNPSRTVLRNTSTPSRLVGQGRRRRPASWVLVDIRRTLSMTRAGSRIRLSFQSPSARCFGRCRCALLRCL